MQRLNEAREEHLALIKRRSQRQRPTAQRDTANKASKSGAPKAAAFARPKPKAIPAGAVTSLRTSARSIAAQRNSVRSSKFRQAGPAEPEVKDEKLDDLTKAALYRVGYGPASPVGA